MLLPYPIPSYPIPSYPILSYPILSYPVLSYPILSCPILSHPVLSCSILSYPILSCPILSDLFSIFIVFYLLFSNFDLHNKPRCLYPGYVNRKVLDKKSFPLHDARVSTDTAHMYILYIYRTYHIDHIQFITFILNHIFSITHSSQSSISSNDLFLILSTNLLINPTDFCFHEKNSILLKIRRR